MAAMLGRKKDMGGSLVDSRRRGITQYSVLAYQVSSLEPWSLEPLAAQVLRSRSPDGPSNPLCPPGAEYEEQCRARLPRNTESHCCSAESGWRTAHWPSEPCFPWGGRARGRLHSHRGPQGCNCPGKRRRHCGFSPPTVQHCQWRCEGVRERSG